MKKKKKIPTLPAHISPFIPDEVAGIDNLNTNLAVNGNASGEALGEEIMSTTDINKLKTDIMDATFQYMRTVDFEEEDIAAWTNFDIEESTTDIRIEIDVELSLDEQGELAQILTPIVQQLDPEAQITWERFGVLSILIHKNISLEERFSQLDNTYLSDISSLYESTQNKLSNSDKDKLAEFVSKTDDVDEIQTYLTGLLNKKSGALTEWINSTSELDDEFDQYAQECSGNIYKDLPKWCQLYLDEFDGPWVGYGKLPSGIYFFSDDYDTTYYANKADFLNDMKYNLQETQKAYKENPEAYDYSVEFTDLLESEASSQFLTEAGGYPDDMGHRYGDYGPGSPWYNGPEPEGVDFDDALEIEFSQRGVIADNYWETVDVGFDDDLDSVDYDSVIYYDDEELGEFDADAVKEAVYDVLSSDEFQQRLPLDDPAVYKVTGLIEIPYAVEDVVSYTEIDYDYESVETTYDTTDMYVRFYPNKVKIKTLHIERISF